MLTRTIAVISILMATVLMAFKPVDQVSSLTEPLPVKEWVSILADDINGSSSVNSMFVDGAENIFVTGSSSVTWGSPIRDLYGSNDVLVAKFDKDHHLIWNTFLGGYGSEVATGITIDENGNIYVSGFGTANWEPQGTLSPIADFHGHPSSAFLAKLDPDGNLLWYTFPANGYNDQGNTVGADGNGNVYLGGWIVNSLGGNQSGFLLKLNGDGLYQWGTVLGGDNSAVNDMVLDGSSNILAIGESGSTWGTSIVRPYTGQKDIFITRTNSAGAILWTSFVGGEDDDLGSRIALDENSYIYLAGRSYAGWGTPVLPYHPNDTIPVGDDADALVAKLDPAGNLLWHTFLGSDNKDVAWGIAIQNGRIALCGTSAAVWGTPLWSYDGGEDAFVAGLDSNGALLWNGFSGNGGDDECLAIQSFGDQSIYFGGFIATPNTDSAYVAKLNLGKSIFTDITPNYWARQAIEDLYSAGVTSGCGNSNFCPASTVTRDQMAVFLLRGEHGASYLPPKATGIFDDVDPSYWAADWIEQLAVEQITSGCSATPSLYCPSKAVTRDQMAVFLLRAKHGPEYVPPKATGVFQDVPTDYWAADWIEQLAAEGVTSGCTISPKQYCPASTVTRDQMAVLLVRNFGLAKP